MEYKKYFGFVSIQVTETQGDPNMLRTVVEEHAYNPFYTTHSFLLWYHSDAKTRWQFLLYLAQHTIAKNNCRASIHIYTVPQELLSLF